MAQMQNVDSLGSLTNILSLIKGGSQTSTTKSNVSSEGVNAIIQQILGGTSGLASVAGGQKSAGLYNSSTNTLLTNDLITRTAGEIAKQQAGTTTTQKTAPKVGGNDILGILGVAGGKALLGPTVAGLSKKYGVDDIGNKIANAFGVGASDGAAALTSTIAGSFGGGAIGGLSDFGGSLGSGFLDLAAPGFSDALSSVGSDFVTSAFSDTAGSVAADAGSSFLSSLFG